MHATCLLKKEKSVLMGYAGSGMRRVGSGFTAPGSRDQQFFEGLIRDQVCHFCQIRNQNVSHFWNEGSEIWEENGINGEKTYLITTQHIFLSATCRNLLQKEETSSTLRIKAILQRFCCTEN